MPTPNLPWYKRLAEAVSTLSMGVVFVLFIYGVGMRYLLNRPVSWTDEAVTVLMVWSVLWTGAFVLRWSEHISFDIVFVNLAPKRQRLMLLVRQHCLRRFDARRFARYGGLHPVPLA